MTWERAGISKGIEGTNHRENIGKLDFKVTNFLSSKDALVTVRGQARDFQKIFAKYTPGKGPVSRIYKGFHGSAVRRQLGKERARPLNRYFMAGLPVSQQANEKVLVVTGRRRNTKPR